MDGVGLKSPAPSPSAACSPAALEWAEAGPMDAFRRLYDRVLERYNAASAVPLGSLLRDERPISECLAAVLEEAARHYAADPQAAGCLVLTVPHMVPVPQSPNRVFRDDLRGLDADGVRDLWARHR